MKATYAGMPSAAAINPARSTDQPVSHVISSTLPTLLGRDGCTSYVDCQGRKFGFISARSVHGFWRVAPVA